jgi:hypothetical protein
MRIPLTETSRRNADPAAVGGAPATTAPSAIAARNAARLLIRSPHRRSIVFAHSSGPILSPGPSLRYVFFETADRTCK